MFEKAREFREKYYVQARPAEDNSDLARANIILDKHAQTYARQAAKVKSEILILEQEISIIQDEVDEFLAIYYKKLSDVLMVQRVYSTYENSIQTSDENHETINLFEKRNEAFSRELKKIYRQLVKNFHPDVNHDQYELKYFYRVQSLYEKGDLSELLYMQSRMESVNNVTENIMLKIERLEAEIKSGRRKIVRLIEKKSEMISSSEYQLFMRFKLSEVRGYNFFDEVLKTASLN